MTRRKIILDCDPGQDDAVAILLALASTELDVLAITAVAGNIGIEKTSLNARAVVELARAATPVYAGCPRPLVREPVLATHIHGESGIDGASLSPPNRPLADGHAVDFIRDTIRAHPPDEITLVAIGPLTNLACALIQAPDIAGRVQEIVLMGGAIGLGNTTPAAEFNIYADPHAAHVVFNSGARIVMTPLELTHQVLATHGRVATIRALGTEAARQVAGILDAYPKTTHFGATGGPLHDPCAVAYLLWPDLMGGKDCRVDIETEATHSIGRTVIEWRRQKTAANAHVLDTVDAEMLFRRITERLGRLP
ncbi:MAG: nucleoside hydrolase [Alphaproteobacteria bacterium]|nr:nucleoside hydrolase [Alphaproteobacteria bacterium]